MYVIYVYSTSLLLPDCKSGRYGCSWLARRLVTGRMHRIVLYACFLDCSLHIIGQTFVDGLQFDESFATPFRSVSESSLSESYRILSESQSGEGGSAMPVLGF